jgi:hypothetical protein
MANKNGTTGNDTVTFGQDGIDDTYDGLAGNDTLAADASVTANLTIDMVAGTLHRARYVHELRERHRRVGQRPDQR